MEQSGAPAKGSIGHIGAELRRPPGCCGVSPRLTKRLLTDVRVWPEGIASRNSLPFIPMTPARASNLSSASHPRTEGRS
jgi:hypothetical protein